MKLEPGRAAAGDGSGGGVSLGGGSGDGLCVGVRDLGRVSYEEAYAAQLEEHARVLAARDNGGPGVEGSGEGGVGFGTVLLVEHVPGVITVSGRAGAAGHVLAGRERLAELGVEVCETDRGGDVTYHGEGQLVAYPIVDLNRVGLRLHGYMRLLEEAAIRVCAGYGLEVGRDEGATGVWVGRGAGAGKVCAVGVRVRRWVTMHGLALNVTTDLSKFGLIVPCGLVGRRVTSLSAEGVTGVTVDEVKGRLVGVLSALLLEAHEKRPGV